MNKSMTNQHLCPNCMRPVPESGDSCPACGWASGARQENYHALPPYTVLDGRYITGNVIGEGGFGITYIAFDKKLEVRVAIKEFYPGGLATREAKITNEVTAYTDGITEDYGKLKSRFIDEAKNLAKLSDHPGIVEVNDYFEENNTVYIVMNYIDGISLGMYLRNAGGRLPVPEVLRMMEPVIRSMEDVHAAGIVHRDISPDNIMVKTDGTVRLIDFGAARQESPEGDKSLSVMLKRGYAPEEQYRSRGRQGPWTDVYAICATIYRCITGEIPPEAVERLAGQALLSPSQKGVAVPESVEQTLIAGLELRQENRIRSMRELYAGLYENKVPVKRKASPGEDTATIRLEEESGARVVPVQTAHSGSKRFTMKRTVPLVLVIVLIAGSAIYRNLSGSKPAGSGSAGSGTAGSAVKGPVFPETDTPVREAEDIKSPGQWEIQGEITSFEALEEEFFVDSGVGALLYGTTEGVFIRDMEGRRILDEPLVYAQAIGEELIMVRSKANAPNNVGLVTVSGEVLIPCEAARIRASQNSKRYLEVVYEDPGASGREDAFTFKLYDESESELVFDEEKQLYRRRSETIRPVSTEDGEEHTGYAVLYDVLKKTFVSKSRTDYGGYQGAIPCGDHFLVPLREGGYALYDADERLVSTYGGNGSYIYVYASGVSDGFFVLNDTEVYDETGKRLFGRSGGHLSFGYGASVLHETNRDREEITIYNMDNEAVVTLKGTLVTAYTEDHIITYGSDGYRLYDGEGREVLHADSYIGEYLPGVFCTQTSGDTVYHTIITSTGEYLAEREPWGDRIYHIKDGYGYVLSDKAYTLDLTGRDVKGGVATFTVVARDAQSGTVSLYDLVSGRELLSGYDEISGYAVANTGGRFFARKDGRWHVFRIRYENALPGT